MSNALTSLSLTSLLEARKRIPPGLKIAQGSLDQWPGSRTGPRRGQGLEFVELRRYLPGDDIRHIDWNVTARTNLPHTRLYREDREHTTSVLVDFRSCMFVGSTVLKAVKAGELAALALWQAWHSGDRCSAIVFTDTEIVATRPSSTEKGVLRACESIASGYQAACAAAQTSNNNSIPEFAELLHWLARTSKRAGTHILFSGFDHISHYADKTTLIALRKQHRIIPVWLLDALEVDGIPSGRYAYRSDQGDIHIKLNSKSTDILRHKLRQLMRDKRALFTQSNLPLIEFDTRSDVSRLIKQLTYSTAWHER